MKQKKIGLVIKMWIMFIAKFIYIPTYNNSLNSIAEFFFFLNQEWPRIFFKEHENKMKRNISVLYSILSYDSFFL